jgi:hypothetical protein
MRYGEFVPALLLVLVAYRRNSTNRSLERQNPTTFLLARGYFVKVLNKFLAPIILGSHIE